MDDPSAVIDSITAQTGSRWTSSIRCARVLSEPESGGTDELVEVLALVAEQADVNFLSTEV